MSGLQCSIQKLEDTPAWLGTMMPKQNISGRFLTFTFTYSFIADISSPRLKFLLLSVQSLVFVEKNLKILIFFLLQLFNNKYLYKYFKENSMCFQISKPTLFPLGAWFLIFDSGSYDCVFGCSLLLFVIVSGLGIYLWE